MENWTIETGDVQLFNIILAEDNAADALLVREALKEHAVNCNVRVIRDGAEVIALIDRLDIAGQKISLPDLLILDMHLPKQDGEDILRHLRSTERCAQIPVLVMTSLDSSIVQEMAAKHAALSYFRKPSVLDEFMQLGRIVRNLLKADKRSASTSGSISMDRHA